MSDTESRVDAPEASPHQPNRVALLLTHPLSTYYLLLGTTLLLLVLGLIMVLSASSIESFRVFGSAYTLAQRQGMFAVLGVVAMLFAARTSVQFWRGFAWILFILAFGLLVAVLFIGVEVAGQRNWIEIVGPFRLQPSEFAKLALVVILTGLHGYYVVEGKRLARGERRRSEKFWRMMNEVPFLIAIAVVILAVVEPF